MKPIEFVVMLVVFVFIIGIAAASFYHGSTREQDCNDKGGVVVRGYDRHYCVNKSALIE